MSCSQKEKKPKEAGARNGPNRTVLYKDFNKKRKDPEAGGREGIFGLPGKGPEKAAGMEVREGVRERRFQTLVQPLAR